MRRLVTSPTQSVGTQKSAITGRKIFPLGHPLVVPDWASLSYAGFVLAGYFKSGPIFQKVPVDLTVLLAAIVLLACGARLFQKRLVIPRRFFMVVAFFAIFCVPILWSSFDPYATEKISRFLTITLLATVAPFFLVRSRHDVTKIIYSFLLLGLGLTAIGIVNGPQYGRYGYEQLSALGGNTIAFGRATGMTLIIILFLALARRVGFVTSGVLALPILYGLVASGSRGPLAAVFLATILTLLFQGQRSRRRLVALFGISVLLFVGAWYSISVSPESATSRIRNLAQGRFDASEQTRIRAFHQALEGIKSNPKGTGWGGFEQRTHTIYVSGTIVLPLSYPHNIALEIFYEGGWLVGALFSALVIRSLQLARNTAARLEGTIILGLILFFLLNAMVSGDINDNRQLFSFMGLAAATYSIDPRALLL